MNASAAGGTCRRRLIGAGQVVVSFLGACLIGGLILAWAFGPLAIIYPFGAILMGFPSLVVAVALRTIYDRTSGEYPIACCLAAPFIASTTFLAFWWAADYRQRGYGLVDYLALDGVGAEFVLGLFFSGIASVIFYLWERRSRPD